MQSAEQWIQSLQMRRHPEGGWYREFYRSNESIPQRCLPVRFAGDRAFSTAIYFLLEGTEFSALHRIQQDELWHFYDGSPLTVHVIDTVGNYSAIALGRDLSTGQRPMALVRGGCFFGATVDDSSSYALVGCTVSPGFTFDDFEMPGRERLLNLYPQHHDIIVKLTA